MNDAYEAPTKRVARLAAAPFMEAAQSTAEQLIATGSAHVYLQPDDATLYRFILMTPDRTGTKYFLVVLATSFGCSYEWVGLVLDPGYCAAKWVPNGNIHTGAIVSRFLTELAPLVTSLRASQS